MRPVGVRQAMAVVPAQHRFARPAGDLLRSGAPALHHAGGVEQDERLIGDAVHQDMGRAPGHARCQGRPPRARAVRRRVRRGRSAPPGGPWVRRRGLPSASQIAPSSRPPLPSTRMPAQKWTSGDVGRGHQVGRGHGTTGLHRGDDRRSRFGRHEPRPGPLARLTRAGGNRPGIGFQRTRAGDEGGGDLAQRGDSARQRRQCRLIPPSWRDGARRRTQQPADILRLAAGMGGQAVAADAPGYSWQDPALALALPHLRRRLGGGRGWRAAHLQARVTRRSRARHA